MLLVGLILDAILCQGGLSVFDGEGLAVQPDHGRMPRQCFFTIELPAAEMGIAQPIQATQETGRIKDAMQLLARVQPLHVGPSQHFGRAMVVVRPVPKGPVGLGVVVVHEASVGEFRALPTGGLLKLHLAHAAHYVNVSSGYYWLITARTSGVTWSDGFLGWWQ